MQWLDGITKSKGMNLSKLQERVKDSGAWFAAVYGIAKSWTWLTDWATTEISSWVEVGVIPKKADTPGFKTLLSMLCVSYLAFLSLMNHKGVMEVIMHPYCIDWMWKYLAKSPVLNRYLKNDVLFNDNRVPKLHLPVWWHLSFAFFSFKWLIAFESTERWLSIFISLKPPPIEQDMKKGVNELAFFLSRILVAQIILIPKDYFFWYILSFSQLERIMSHMGSVDPQIHILGA